MSRARYLRKQSTAAERKLWRHLRNRRLINQKFRRQHPIDPYILDFYCPNKRLAVELDGSGHNNDADRRHDEERAQFLARRGILVLRFWNKQIRNNLGGVLETITTALASRSDPSGSATPDR